MSEHKNNEPRHGHSCAICGAVRHSGKTLALSGLRPSLVERMRLDHPDLKPDAAVCLDHIAD